MKNTILTLVLVCSYFFSYAQQKEYTISGYIKDINTGESLIGAVIATDSGVGSMTNSYGFYSFNTKSKNLDLTISCLGYDDNKKNLQIESNITLNVSLTSMSIQLDSVIIISKRPTLAQVKTYGVVGVNAEMLKYIPSFMGEQDIFKYFQLQPGVSAGKEGSSGMNLRGGSSDQTLILMDDIPIYNHSHAFGFVSIFSGEFIKSAELYKGYVPPEYGGRLSGVATMNTRDGNRKEHKQSIQLGTTTFSAMAEGPINNGKGSYLIGGRYFIPDLLLRGAGLFMSENSTNISVGFYDITAKISYDLGEKHTLSANFYTGNDAINFSQKNADFNGDGENFVTQNSGGLSWGNMVGSLQLSSQLTNKLFLNTTAYYSHLANQSNTDVFQTFEGSDISYNNESKISSQLGEFGLKMLFQQNVNSWYNLSYGLNFAHQEFTPQSYYTNNNGYITETRYGKEQLLTGTLFLDNKFNFNKFDVNIGGRLSMYDNGTENIVVAEPRVSVNYNMPNSSLWIGYVQNTQPLFSLNQLYYSMPVDYWVPFKNADELPRSEQLSLGYKYNFDFGLELFAETYLKRGNNISLIYNADDYLLDEGGYDLATNKAYGFEFMAQYRKGRYNAMASYAYSNSQNTFDGKTVDFIYDTPHNMNIFGSYQTVKKENKKHTLSININFKTGVPYLMTNEAYPSINDSPDDKPDISAYPKYLERRLENFFRVDLNYSMEKKLKNGSRIWQISILNATAHQNPYIVYNDKSGYKAFMLIPFLPSFSYKRMF